MKKAEVRQMVLGMISTNCYICVNRETREAFIVDPADRADAVRMMLRQIGATPVAVLLTHGHFDHIGAADALRSAFGIQVYIQEADEPMLENATLNHSATWATPVTLKADHRLKDGDELNLAGFTVQVIHTPGHTPGGCCYYVPEEDLLFSGDTLFFCSVGRTDFPGSSTAAIKASLERLMEELPEETDVLPGHGETTTISFEKRNNPYV